MVLDIPGVQGLFGNSPYQGDGYGSNIAQRRRNEGRQGAVTSLLYTKEGTTIATAEVELDNFTIHKGDFQKEEEIEIIISVIDQSTGAKGVLKMRLADEGSGTTIANLIDAAKGANKFSMRLIQTAAEDTDITGNILCEHGNGTVTTVYGNWDLSLKDVLTKQFTISIRGYVDTGGTLYWKWTIYRRGHN